jgi:mannose/fructose/N-acetylgalactosamine-specific phosphotransferase system component IIB
MDGELTGIESSTDLIHWQVATQWVMQSDWPASVIVSNTWCDTGAASQKFYRAFNRAP